MSESVTLAPGQQVHAHDRKAQVSGVVRAFTARMVLLDVGGDAREFPRRDVCGAECSK